MGMKKRKRTKRSNRIMAAITRKNGRYYYINYQSAKIVKKQKKEL